MVLLQPKYLIIALLVASVFGIDTPSDVVVLTTANFKENLAKGDWLVEFYAPWCGHCKKLAPIYEQLATALKGKINVGKVDCTSEEFLQEAFGIPGYPSIKFIKGKEVFDFNGDRTQEGFVAFVEGGYKSQTPKSLPSLESKAPIAESTENSDVVVLTDANFDDLTSKGIWFLEFYAPWCGHCKKLAPIYDQLATSLKGSINVGKVDCTVQTSLARRFGIRSYPTIKFLKDGEIRDYKLERTLEAMTQFSSTGYTSVETSALPPKPTPMEDMIEEAKAQFKKVEVFLVQRVWISMGAIFVVGVIFGALFFGGSRSSKPAQPKTQKQE